MRAKVLLSLVGATIAAVALVSASGAATARAQKVTRLDVSTRSAVVHYLRSIHVKAKGAVVQRGALNYAGAHCPGTEWTCASTKHTVVQIAKRGGKNRFACRSAHCVVVQISGVSRGVYLSGRMLASAAAAPKGGSTATCVKTGSGATTGTGQSCVISQTGSGPNTAGVYENTSKVSGLVQSAAYTASITQQSSGANLNQACVTQAISLDGSTTNTNGKQTTANLQAHQSILISQNNSGTGTGDNAATNSARYAATSTGACDTSHQLSQSQTLTSTVTATGPITQNENVGYSPCGDGITGDYANLCLKIDQNQALPCTGPTACPSTTKNFAVFTQNSTQSAVANATKGAQVIQQQSTPSCTATPTRVGPDDCVAGSGLVGTINQDSLGQSIASPTQNEVQCEDAAISGLSSCSQTADTSDIPSGKLSQSQYGPVGVGNLPSHHPRGRVLFSHLKGLGQAHQHGNTTDTYTIIQISTQYADVGVVQQNFGNADCTTAGFCTATQSTTTNGGTTQDGYTAPSITGLAINCPTGTTCKGTPPPKPTSVSGPVSDPNPSASAAFSFADTATGGFHFLCKVDSGTPQTCSSDTAFFQGYGPHTFQVAASDSHGNVSDYVPANAISWTNVPPDPTISSGPDQPDSTSRDATFSFHDAESPVKFVCKLDGASSYSACPTTTPTYSGLALGPHTLLVKATDTSGLYQSVGNAEYDWSVIPYLSFEASSDGASGWSDGAKSPIDLTTGADIPNTFAQVTLHNFEDIALSDLVGAGGPTFTTDNYAAGSPRYVIDLDNGDSLWGYPPNSGLNGLDFAWAINNGNTYESWSDVLSAEPGAKVADVVVVADGDQVSTTDVITDLTFDGYNFNPSS